MEQLRMSLHQALFGYRDGHRLLSSSRQFLPQTERALVALSDLSGSRIQPGFEVYISGYSVPEEECYAISKTWYASEMERPGCVWTQMLFIPNKEIGKAHLNSLLVLFTRPTAGSINYYRSQIEIQANGANTSKLVLSENNISNVLFCLYNKPDLPVLLPADNANQFENLIIAIWEQQWPQLRSSFKFCSGSLSNRSLNGQPFDFQVVPKRIAREMERDFKSVQICNLLQTEPLGKGDEWLRYATFDIMQDGPLKFREFIWKYADASNCPKSIYKPLAILFNLFNNNGIKIEHILKTIASVYPGSEEGTQLKEDVFCFDSNSIAGESEKLKVLALTDSWKSFNPIGLKLRLRAKQLWQTNKVEAENLMFKILSTPQPLGDEIIEGFIEGMTPQEACSFSEGKGGVLIEILARNPIFLTQNEFWACKLPQYLLYDILDMLKGEVSNSICILEWLPAFLQNDTNDLAEAVVQRFDKKAVMAFLKVYNSDIELPWPPPITWRSVLSKYQAPILELISKFDHHSIRLRALLTLLLESNSQQARTLGIEFWENLIDQPNFILEIPNADATAFLLSIALQSDQIITTRFISTTFQPVYMAASIDNLSYRGWQMLINNVPVLGNRRNWDKCERLRRALICKFNKHQWTTTDFLTVIRHPDIFRSTISTACEISDGQQYLDRIKNDIANDRLQGTSEQIKLLRDSLRKDWWGNFKFDV